MLTTLQAADTWTSNHIQGSGDGPLPYGSFKWNGVGGIQIAIVNANNHQLTFGVVGSVLVGLEGCMERNGYAEADFDVFDGANQVGTGVVGASWGG